MKIYMPNYLKIDNILEIKNLIKAVNDIVSIPTVSVVEFDFSNSKFISAEMTVFLTVLFSRIKNVNKIYKCTRMNPALRKTFIRNNFLPKIMGEDKFYSDSYGNMISFYKENANNSESLEKYLNNEVFKSNKWLKVTNSNTKQEITYAFHELAANVVEHSTVNNVYCCGQYYPNLHEIRFAVADDGQTIPVNIRNYNQALSNLTDVQLIQWATEEGNSTKNVPESGLGLYDVKTMLSQLGRLSIISNKGLWNTDGLEENMDVPLNGTFIHFDVRLNNENLGLNKNNGILVF